MSTENQAIVKYDATSYPIDPKVFSYLFNPIVNKYGILVKNLMNNLIKKETYKDIFNVI